jgi:hypothetical protein
MVRLTQGFMPLLSEVMIMNLNEGLQQNVKAWNCKQITQQEQMQNEDCLFTMTWQMLHWCQLFSVCKNCHGEGNVMFGAPGENVQKRWRRRRKTETPDALRPLWPQQKAPLLLWMARLGWLDDWMIGWMDEWMIVWSCDCGVMDCLLQKGKSAVTVTVTVTVLVDGWWLMVLDGWWSSMVDGPQRLTVLDGWWSMVDGFWMVDGGWWLMINGHAAALMLLLGDCQQFHTRNSHDKKFNQTPLWLLKRMENAVLGALWRPAGCCSTHAVQRKF